jgi:hypothetical protein
MRYLVTARLREGREKALRDAIEKRTLGRGSIAGGEYQRNMRDARACPDGAVRWVEVCYCRTPLAEERPHWEPYFELVSIKDAHARGRCKDENGTEPWSCGGCDCTTRLEAKLARRGTPFLRTLEDTNP